MRRAIFTARLLWVDLLTAARSSSFRSVPVVGLRLFFTPSAAGQMVSSLPALRWTPQAIFTELFLAEENFRTAPSLVSDRDSKRPPPPAACTKQASSIFPLG